MNQINSKCCFPNPDSKPLSPLNLYIRKETKQKYRLHHNKWRQVTVKLCCHNLSAE